MQGNTEFVPGDAILHVCLSGLRDVQLSGTNARCRFMRTCDIRVTAQGSDILGEVAGLVRFGHTRRLAEVEKDMVVVALTQGEAVYVTTRPSTPA